VSHNGSGGAEGRFDVVNPQGAQQRAELHNSPPLTDLPGRRIAFLWDLLFKGDFVFAQIANELSRSYDGMTFVDHQRFGDIHGGDERQVLADLRELLRQERVDAVVVGVGA
jgi:hypothetical protein